MSEPYLIAHLVRGEPAFDIAEQIEIGDELGWIIPTSGHRAYPYWSSPLLGLLMLAFDEQYIYEGQSGLQYTGEPYITPPPPDWPDHYAPSAAPRGQGLITNLAERLGLIPKPPTITRR